MQKRDINELIVRAKRRDKDAFTELINRYMQDMYKVALAILMNDEDVADAIQETILNCWEKIDTLRVNKYFKTWLTKILMNNCYDIIRNGQNQAEIHEWDEPTYEDDCNLELKEALSKLEEKYRVIIVMFYWQGYSIDEISKVLDLPANTVKTRLKRGRERLARYYEIVE
ncbi:RNA polymerase sigma-70 factor, ECF subfamily [Pseudobutyrivibrio sp. UC1225]|uniref:RNA polymerase sigma factor n=1 Tax=Pseudobutyrivibrio sp. UC1225 TaxID=1798185 RepID=UPI0008E7593F|nr:sigma-70 family RNA polymerase sigma factor [Pseudobutyrivibrio sp. UC1225]SFO09950.1 RNA polymerase sigma-70 factor, ECF subfamily [Pseudobutyrivibrio sp. UC1225]